MSHDDTLEDYEPSPVGWVRRQVELYESSGGTEGTTLRDTGQPVVIVTTRGARTGKLRKVPLMRVEHEGAYAAIASQGGAPKHPVWYYNLLNDPECTLRDRQDVWPMRARLVEGQEREEWWARAVEAFPPYAEYQTKTDREIPLFVLETRDPV
jgi:deazaflavin-dependent oxidoreductase (nitroreductase family)